MAWHHYALRYPHEGLKGGFDYETVPHITLKSIANNPDIDTIHAEHQPKIAAALADLNAALARSPPTPLEPPQGVRKGNAVDFAKGDTLHGWEVPFDWPKDWPEAARAPFDAFHVARQAMQRRMDQSIADHAEQETLYDKPRIDRSKRRFSGPFSVEAVPAPTVLSLDESLSPQDADETVARWRMRRAAGTACAGRCGQSWTRTCWSSSTAPSQCASRRARTGVSRSRSWTTAGSSRSRSCRSRGKLMSLIINTPFECPAQHWVEGNGGKLEIKPERRPASYEVFDARNNTKRTEVLDLVNTIRARLNAWRADGWPGVTIVTRKLLEHWHDRTARFLESQDKQPEPPYPFYFCQIEAIETLIWWVEGAEAYKQGIRVPGDGGAWERLCNKMATGAGKTTVMAMIITWQVLNALTYPKRNKDFSRAVFIVAPGLTVKERLQVLMPSAGSYYDEFDLCPSEALRQKLNQAEVLIENWHTLMPLKDVDRSVVKKGRESDEAFTRRVLGKLAAHKDIIVINDEAHHAYRKPPEVKISKKQAAEQGIDLDEATRWIEGLDRIHKTRRIQRCFDLSATPFAPTGKKSTEAALFDWIVSDFGLNDAIEAGLVKTPRVVVRDDALPDARTLRSKLYHIYRDPSVSEDLNRAKTEPHEALPKLVQDAYTLLGADWRETQRQWREAGHHSPPVMLTVCNRTECQSARNRHPGSACKSDPF
jgi:Type III restriction enzyme, res subunit